MWLRDGNPMNVCNKYAIGSIVCKNIPSKTPPAVSCQASLKSAHCPSPSPFLGNLPLYIGFSWFFKF